MSDYRPINDPIARHARPLISWLEEKIEKEYGIKVLIGCEKEFYLEFHPVPGQQELDSAQKSEMVVRAWKDIVDRLKEKLNNAAVRAPLERFYNEDELNQFELTTAPASPLRAVQRLDMQCRQLEQYVASSRHVNSRLALKNISYLPYCHNGKEPTLAGLHVNFSLWKNNHNLLKPPTTQDSGRSRWPRIVQALSNYAFYDELLIAPSEEAQRRKMGGSVLYVHNTDLSVKIRSHALKEPDYERHRAEFRFPSADARHDLAVLMVMTAIYNGLDRSQMEIHTPKWKPGGLSEAIDRFRHESRMMIHLRLIAGEEKNTEMLEHVNSLNNEILKSAAEARLTQPVFTKPERLAALT